MMTTQRAMTPLEQLLADFRRIAVADLAQMLDAYLAGENDFDGFLNVVYLQADRVLTPADERAVDRMLRQLWYAATGIPA